jgi:Xaa-Pro aminopeptidase
VNYEGRVSRLRDEFETTGVEALLVTNLTNVRYITGFSGTNGQVVVGRDTVSFFTDPRYRARASQLVHGADVSIYANKLTDLLGDHLDGVRRLGVEGSSMNLLERDELAQALPGVELVTTKGMIEELRRVKEPEELELIQQAVDIADHAFDWVVDRLQVGVAERDFALELEVHMRKEGAEAVSFNPIVGSGPLSAHIHHTASDRLLEKNDLVLLDFGARLDGYCSDLTRTVVLGPPSDEQVAIYEIVLAAQLAGIGAVRSEASCVEVDAAARSIISDAGYGEAFGHGLGHGVGLDIHEAPRLARFSDDFLQAGDVVTVEPGIYLDGLGGVRIEDCVVVGDGGARMLSRAPKNELLEL